MLHYNLIMGLQLHNLGPELGAAGGAGLVLAGMKGGGTHQAWERVASCQAAAILQAGNQRSRYRTVPINSIKVLTSSSDEPGPGCYKEQTTANRPVSPEQQNLQQGRFKS